MGNYCIFHILSPISLHSLVKSQIRCFTCSRLSVSGVNNKVVSGFINQKYLILFHCRCIPLWFPSFGGFDVLCHLGAWLNGIGGPIAMSAPIQISASWFPPHERTRATSIGQMFNALGVGVSYLLGSTIVSKDDQENSDPKDDITILLSLYSGVSALIFLLVLVYYPSKPPCPPSNTAAEERLDIFSGWKDLVKNLNCWLVTICYAMSQALNQMWQSTIVITFTETAVMLDMDKGITENWASTLGMVVGFSSVAASILVATFMDFFRKRMKIAIVVLLTLSLLFSIVITLISENVIQFNNEHTFKVVMYILSICAVGLACSAAPITFEFCAELCYPVSEGLLGIVARK